MAKANTHRRTKKLQRAMAESYVSGYCAAHNLSMEKLRNQRFEIVADMMVFAQPTGIRPDGLCNDIETRPFPTLIIRLDDAGIPVIQMTKDTIKYLAKDSNS